MLTTILQAVLPGIRDFRTPLVAGLLWLLFGWLMLASDVPTSEAARGFIGQVFYLSQKAGNGTSITAVAIVAYVLGVLAVTLATFLRGVAASLVTPLILYWRLQRWARRKRADLRKAARTDSDEARKAKEALAIISRHETLAGLWISWSAEVRNVAGRPSDYGREYDVEFRIERRLRDAWEKGVVDELRAQNTEVLDRLPSATLDDLSEELLANLKDDPLSVLRVVDDAFFHTMERERSEREFRVAVMPPVVAICVYCWVSMTPWASLGVVLGVAAFVQAAVVQSNEVSLVINHLLMRGLPGTSLNAAEARGRMDARRQLAAAKRQRAKVAG